MKNIILFGLDQFADTMYELLKEEDRYEIVGFCVDRVYLPKVNKKNNLPIVAFDEIKKIFPPEVNDIIFCIGYTKMNLIRKEKMHQAIEWGYNVVGYKHPTAVVQTETVGFGNIFMEGVVIGRGVKIGDGNIFWPLAHVAHHTVVGSYNFFTISVAVAGNIIIGDNCVFGANCTIKNGISVANGTLVGAGAYISSSTEEYSVYVPPRSYKLESKSSLDFKL